MNFHDIYQRAKIFTTRQTIERPILPSVHRFRVMLFLSWIVALAALFYGHYSLDESFSLMLSGISWIVATLLVLVNQPISRLKLLVGQITSILLIVVLVLTLGITYSILYVAGNVSTSIKIAWASASVLLGGISLPLLFRSFITPYRAENRYPGMFSSPILFGLLLLNYIWWKWDAIIAWLK